MKVNYAYLHQQFADVEGYFEDLRELVASGEFTLGPYVERFERKFGDYIGIKHVIGVNTGTDALILCLKALGIGAGDEVITVPNTFYATVGAIVAVGARPVFIDVDERMQMDPALLEAAITSSTKAVIPVYWAGCCPEIERIISIAEKQDIPVVEDACPAVGARVDGRSAGTWGKISAFSMHPLKPLNVWGDGGMVVTEDDALADWLRMYRNHGMVDRDHNQIWGINARLQPIQAVVATRLLDGMEANISARLRTAAQLDAGLARFPQVRIPARLAGHRDSYQLYQVMVDHRDELLAHLVANEVEAKVHYPLPLHLQAAAKDLGCSPGSFPVCERQAGEILTLPAHQHIGADQVDYTIECIQDFYGKS
jgi:aminotransferase EvaB